MPYALSSSAGLDTDAFPCTGPKCLSDCGTHAQRAFAAMILSSMRLDVPDERRPSAALSNVCFYLISQTGHAQFSCCSSEYLLKLGEKYDIPSLCS